MATDPPEERPCRICGEPTLGQTYDELLCRECAIDAAFMSIACPGCGRYQWNELAATLLGLKAEHAAGCPEAP